MAESVKHLTLDFSSGHDLTVRESEPCIRFHTVSVEPAWDSLSPSLTLHHLKINKLKKGGILSSFQLCSAKGEPQEMWEQEKGGS